MASKQNPSGSKRSLSIIVGVIIIVALVLLAYFGTGLSAGVKEWQTTEIPLVGVTFSFTLKNDGLFEQTKEVHCEVQTGSNTYGDKRNYTIAPGETVKGNMVVLIPGLDPADIVGKKCYTPMF